VKILQQLRLAMSLTASKVRLPQARLLDFHDFLEGFAWCFGGLQNCY
jgi:hypothetical protein